MRLKPVFSLKSLLIVTGLVGAVAGIVGSRWISAYREDQLMRYWSNRGANAHVEGGEVRGLHFAPGKCRDVDLAEVARLRGLIDLGVRKSPITDEGIKRLRGHESLNNLYLDGTQVTDECLKELGTMPSLAFVTVTRTSVSPEGARELLRLSRGRIGVAGAGEK